MQTDIARKRFTVGALRKMLDAGILVEGERVELIGGEILEMTSMGVRHAAAITQADRLFTVTFADALVRVRLPLHLDDWNEPEPDVCIVQSRTDFYGARHPRPGDVLFLVEIGDTSLEYDRNVKLPLYGAAGVEEVWIVDLNANALTVHRHPSGSTYQHVETLSPGDAVSPAAFPKARVRVSDLLP